MSDEQTNNSQPEKPSTNTPREAQQESKPQEKPSETKQLNFSESAVKNAGDQGISLNPVGSHNTNPFMAQDIVQTQPAAQITPPPTATVTPPPAAQSRGDTHEAGE